MSSPSERSSQAIQDRPSWQEVSANGSTQSLKESLKFDIDEFQSPIVKQEMMNQPEDTMIVKVPLQTEKTSKPHPERTLHTLDSSEPVESSAPGPSSLPPILSMADSDVAHRSRGVVFRDIGTIEVTIAPTETDLVESIFRSPTLLLLHVMKVKHHIKFMSSNHDDPRFRLSFTHGATSFTATVSSKAMQTEYPIIRQLSRRLGHYGTSESEEQDLWFDEFLALCSIWASLMDEHDHLIRTIVQGDDIPNATMTKVEHYISKREELYRALNAAWKRRGGASTDRRDDPCSLLTQHILYQEGAMRESVLEKINDVYTRVWQKNRENSEASEWLRTIHTSWSQDYLLDHTELYGIHTEVMADAIVRGWYSEREAMLAENPFDPSQVLRFHESVMNGTFPPACESESLIQPAERSVALSPRHLLSSEMGGQAMYPQYPSTAGYPPNVHTASAPSPHRFQSQPVHGVSRTEFYEPSRFPSPRDFYAQGQHFDVLHPHPINTKPMDGDLWAHETDWMDDQEHFKLARRSPINQRVCSGPSETRPFEKKTFGFC